jgi:hypothetical protein
MDQVAGARGKFPPESDTKIYNSVSSYGINRREP